MRHKLRPLGKVKLSLSNCKFPLKRTCFFGMWNTLSFCVLWAVDVEPSVLREDSSCIKHKICQKRKCTLSWKKSLKIKEINDVLQTVLGTFSVDLPIKDSYSTLEIPH